MSQKIIVRTPKKEVQRKEFLGQFQSSTTAVQFNTLYTATAKQTIMGYNLHIQIGSNTSTIRGFTLLIGIQKNGETRTPTIASHGATDMDREVLYQRHFMTGVNQVYIGEDLKSKQKRKLNAGDVLVAWCVGSGTSSDTVLSYCGLLYIGQ